MAGNVSPGDIDHQRKVCLYKLLPRLISTRLIRMHAFNQVLFTLWGQFRHFSDFSKIHMQRIIERLGRCIYQRRFERAFCNCCMLPIREYLDLSLFELRKNEVEFWFA